MRKDMTIGNPMKIILLFSLPVLLGNLFQQFYNMVDTVIVGQYLGEDALAAVGSTGCLMFLVLGFANGIAQGFGVMVSHAFGAKDMKLLRHYVALSLLLTVVISMILTVPTVAFSRQLLLWLNTPENIITLANRYIRVIFAGIFATMAYNVASGILRGIGDSRTPLYFLILSSGLNIFLDIFLIVVVKLGTAGAAYATVISQAVSAVLCFIVMFRKHDILRTTREDYYCDFHEIRRMLSVGIPMALNYSITAIGTMMVQSALNILGSYAVAAFTAGNKIENIFTQAYVAIGTTMATYNAQNIGARKLDRVRQGFNCAHIIGIIYAIVTGVIIFFFGKYLSYLFISDNAVEVIPMVDIYVKCVAVFFIPLHFVNALRNGIQGMGYGLLPMLAGVAELAGRGITAMIAAAHKSYFGACMASPMAWVLAGGLLIIMYFYVMKDMKRRLGL